MRQVAEAPVVAEKMPAHLQKKAPWYPYMTGCKEMKGSFIFRILPQPVFVGLHTCMYEEYRHKHCPVRHRDVRRVASRRRIVYSI